MTTVAQPPASAERDVLTESTTIRVDAAPALTERAVRSLDLAAPLLRALTALDVAAAACTGRGTPLRFGLLWGIDSGTVAERIRPECFESFSRPGYVKVRWTVDVAVAGEGARLSITSRLAATDDRTAARLLDAWDLIGPVSRALRERAARAVKDYAEQLAGE